MLRVGSLFSGIGGLELGLERAGMEVVFQAEYDKQPRRVLARHWPDVHRYEDVHDVRISRELVRERNDGVDSEGSPRWRQRELSRGGPRNGGGPTANAGPVDVICGGFPCQDYSVAGKRGGLAGDRGALWWEMHRIVAEQRPTWVVGENVSGLLSSNGGADFRTIIASLVQLGYGVTWATMDSQYFGVAQRRRRLFIIGHSGGVPRPEILAISEGLFGHPAPSREEGPGAAEGVEARTYSKTTAQPDYDNWDAAAVNRTLSTFENASDVRASTIVLAGDGANAEITTDSSPGLGPTLKVGSGIGITTIPRRLTPKECERLQGFPDGWTARYDDGTKVADGPRYRMLGNAVTVSVAEWIGRRIMQAEKQDRARIGFDASQDSQENGADPGSTLGASM